MTTSINEAYIKSELSTKEAARLASIAADDLLWLVVDQSLPIEVFLAALYASKWAARVYYELSRPTPNKG